MGGGRSRAASRSPRATGTPRRRGSRWCWSSGRSCSVWRGGGRIHTHEDAARLGPVGAAAARPRRGAGGAGGGRPTAGGRTRAADHRPARPADPRRRQARPGRRHHVRQRRARRARRVGRPHRDAAAGRVDRRRSPRWGRPGSRSASAAATTRGSARCTGSPRGSGRRRWARRRGGWWRGCDGTRRGRARTGCGWSTTASAADVAAAIDAANAALAVGRPVPLLIGTFVPRHYCLALSRDRRRLARLRAHQRRGPGGAARPRAPQRARRPARLRPAVAPCSLPS